MSRTETVVHPGRRRSPARTALEPRLSRGISLAGSPSWSGDPQKPLLQLRTYRVAEGACLLRHGGGHPHGSSGIPKAIVPLVLACLRKSAEDLVQSSWQRGRTTVAVSRNHRRGITERSSPNRRLPFAELGNAPGVSSLSAKGFLRTLMERSQISIRNGSDFWRRIIAVCRVRQGNSLDPSR